jgi:hypothetical protein
MVDDFEAVDLTREVEFLGKEVSPFQSRCWSILLVPRISLIL